VIQKTKNPGLSELISVAKIERNKITAYNIGFQIGPRINAPGRIDHATKSFELLVTDDKDEAKELSLWLDEKNEERQAAMGLTQQEAIQKITENKLDKDKIIIVNGKWAKGVIGPSASKLVEKYNKPVILFSDEEESLTGSARSVPGVNIVSIFEKASDYIHKFGGHKGAAGITVKKEQYKNFLKEIRKIAEKSISDSDLVKKIRVDCQVDMNELTKGLYEKILLFEPFGMENSKPVFMLEDISFNLPRFVGKTADHFSSLVCKGQRKIKSIYFNFPYQRDLVAGEKKSYDIVFSLDLDEWLGDSKLSFNIIDLKAHD
jgi:single-stranded-DNA-specific exonuclease